MACTSIVIDADHTRTEQGQSAIAEPRVTAKPSANPEPSPKPAKPPAEPVSTREDSPHPAQPDVPSPPPPDASPDAAATDAGRGDAASELPQTTNSVLLISVDGLAQRFVQAQIDAARAPTYPRQQREGSWT
jgi:hypothetical protein